MGEEKQTYPGIHRAALLIAIDNGGLNRFRPEAQIHKEISAWLLQQPDDLLGPISKWLENLSTDDLETVCCGEHGEQLVLLETAPPSTDDLLNRYFEEVC